VAVLVVEQNLRAAVRMAERQLVMVSGRIEAEFAGDELTTRPDLQHRYLGVGTGQPAAAPARQCRTRCACSSPLDRTQPSTGRS
jgi:branched-chain amino acid transport system ATP-binding protein